MPDQFTQNPPGQDPEDEARAARVAEWDEVFQAAQAVPDEDEVVQPQPRSRGFWQGFREKVTALFPAEIVAPKVDPVVTRDVGVAVARGVTKGVDELFEFATEDVAGAVLNTPLESVLGPPGDLVEGTDLPKMALKNLVFDEAELEFYETWYDQKEHIETAIFTDQWRDESLPYENETLAVKMVETVAQFTTGFMLLGGAASGGTWLARAGVNIAKSGVVDGAFFDPHEQRLADVLSAFGVEGSFIDALKANPDDPNIVGRLKNVLEGIIIGGPLDIVLEGFTAFRAIRRGEAGTLSAKEVGAELEAVGRRVDEIAAREPEGPVRVVAGEDGTPHLAIEEAPAAPTKPLGEFEMVEIEGGSIVAQQVSGANYAVLSAGVDKALRRQGRASRMYEEMAQRIEAGGGKLQSAPEGSRSEPAQRFWESLVEKGRATFDEESRVFTYRAKKKVSEPVVPVSSQADAEMQAAAMNAAIKRADRPTGDALRQVKEWQELGADLAQANTLPELLARQSDKAATMPLGRISDTKDMVASARALEDMLPVQLTGKGGKVISEDEILRDVMEIFGDPSMTVETVRRWATRAFESTENLAAKMVGFRQVVLGHGHNLRQTARSLARAPNNPWLATRLAEQWEALVDLSGSVSGTASNAGRTLQSQQIPVGELAGVPKGFEPQAQALSEFKSARRLYNEAIEAGQPEAARAALYRMDQLGEQLGGFVGGKGRPKKHRGLPQIFDRDARRAAKAEAKAAQPELELEGLPPKPDVKQDIPGAMAWHEKAARQIEGEIQTARQTAQAEIEEFNPSEAFAGFKGMTKEDIIALSRVLMSGDDANIDVLMRAITQAKELTRRPKAPGAAAIRHLYISALLSNPITHARNIITNTVMAQAQGIERILAGMPMRRWLGRSKFTPAQSARMRHEGYDFLRFYWSAFSDGWKAGGDAWRLGENVMDPGAMRGDLTKLPTVGEDISIPAAILRPSNINRFMMAADEVAQQMAYRAHTKMSAMRSARESALSASRAAGLQREGPSDSPRGDRAEPQSYLQDRAQL
jgi:ribosomal protein S18 acetylase RimI-like enzyme